MPFGSIWVDRLGEAFFALNEDRMYLPKIVERLIKEAEQQAALNWFQMFSTTKDGEVTNEDALEVLIEAQAAGYHLTKDADGTILVSGKNQGTSYLRSNADIIRFAGFSVRKPSSGV